MDFRIIKEFTEPVHDVESESSISYVINLAKKGNWNMIYLLSKLYQEKCQYLSIAKITTLLIGERLVVLN